MDHTRTRPSKFAAADNKFFTGDLASALGTRSLRPPAWEERFGIFAAPATNVANGFIIAQGYQDDEDDDNANSYDGFWGSWTDDERNRARKVLSPNAKNSWMRIIWKPGPSYRGQGPDARRCSATVGLATRRAEAPQAVWIYILEYLEEGTDENFFSFFGKFRGPCTVCNECIQENAVPG